MADLGPTAFVSFTLMWAATSLIMAQQRDSLESIDKKMHTHAADGSINGIRGWY